MDKYKTRDLGIAAALVTNGHAFIGLETAEKIVNNEKKEYRLFVFDDAENSDGSTAEQTATDYVNHDLLLDPYTFFTQLRELKNRLYGPV